MKGKQITLRISLSTLLLLVGLMVCLPIAAQNGKIKRGHKYYERMVYPVAIRAYEKGLRKTKDLKATERLADAYRQVGNTHKAEKWYGEAVKLPNASPAAKYHYGEMLKANGKYMEARKWFEAYLQTGENPQKAARAIESCDFAEEAKRDSALYAITVEPFNTRSSDFGPVIYGQGLIYVSEKVGGFKRVFNLRNFNHFYDLYELKRGVGKKGYTVKRLKGKVNSAYHDGPATLSSSQDQLYFTRSFFVKNKQAVEPKDRSKLKLLVASNTDGKWRHVSELPFNSETYSCGHPALSADGNTLVFASDIPGGFGGTDLYLARKTGATWGTPENLGSAINTEGDETFPYLHESGALFFASDGQPGLGGMDIFMATASADGRWENALNMGYPLNTSADDFSITWNPNRAAGYFASNRDGDDDIYAFRRNVRIHGTIVDSKTGLPVNAATVKLEDVGGKTTTYVTGSEGKFTHIAEWGRNYRVTVNAQRYLDTIYRVGTNDISPIADKEVQILLTPDVVFTVAGTVTDAQTRQPLPNATVRLVSQKEQKIQGDAQGKYFQKVDENTEYTAIITHPGYVPQVFSFSTEGKTQSEDFVLNAGLEPGHYLIVEGKVFQSTDNAPVEAANVYAIDSKSREEIRAARSRKDGRFWQVLDPARSQYLIGSKTGYFATRAELPAPKADRDTTVWVDVPLLQYEVGAIVKIIYYEYNKADILDVASKDLYEIIYFLNDNPEASVELSAYTDSRGGAAFNEKLSQQRAEAAVAFIIQRGISRKRITAKGYGETQLANKCADEVPCTEDEHSRNRRTEIKVTKIDASKPK